MDTTDYQSTKCQNISQKSRLNVANQWKLDITQTQPVVDVFCN